MVLDCILIGVSIHKPVTILELVRCSLQLLESDEGDIEYLLPTTEPDAQSHWHSVGVHLHLHDYRGQAVCRQVQSCIARSCVPMHSAILDFFPFYPLSLPTLRMAFQVEDYPSFDDMYKSFLLVFQVCSCCVYKRQPPVHL